MKYIILVIALLSLGSCVKEKSNVLQPLTVVDTVYIPVENKKDTILIAPYQNINGIWAIENDINYNITITVIDSCTAIIDFNFSLHSPTDKTATIIYKYAYSNGVLNMYSGNLYPNVKINTLPPISGSVIEWRNIPSMGNYRNIVKL